MGAFANIFTWWNGATFGTWLSTALSGAKVGSDDAGNLYYESKREGANGSKRRWVMYKGSNDASVVSPEWTAWLHGQLDDVPDKSLPPPRAWIKPPEPNLTGTAKAYRPAGALEAGGKRVQATGDYEAWVPE